MATHCPINFLSTYRIIIAIWIYESNSAVHAYIASKITRTALHFAAQKPIHTGLSNLQPKIGF